MTQPEALRLADKLAPAGTHSLAWCKEAAAELRRLHEAHDWQYKMAGDRLRRIEKLESLNQELLELLERVAEALAHCLGSAYEPVVAARAAIAKGEAK